MAKQKVKYRYRNMFRKRSNHKRKITFPLAVISGFVPAGMEIYAQRASPVQMAAALPRIFTGYDFLTGQFSLDNLKHGAIPVFAGFMTHYIASRLGINRLIAQTGIPFIRI